ncbi:hypothetical protein CCP4SC76_5010012 [Gammaproteobacteria bacterium]
MRVCGVAVRKVDWSAVENRNKGLRGKKVLGDLI